MENRITFNQCIKPGNERLLLYARHDGSFCTESRWMDTSGLLLAGRQFEVTISIRLGFKLLLHSND